MWEAWQKRRLSPIHSYTAGTGKTYPLLSMWPSCASPLFSAHAQEFPPTKCGHLCLRACADIVQLPYYSAGSFNSDPKWTALFASHWAADWAYYNTSAYCESSS